MGQITVTLNGRTYRLRCGDGEEERLAELTTHVRKRVDQLAANFGQVGDDRLLLMAAVLIADELWEARDRIAELVAAMPSERKPRGKAARGEAAGPAEGLQPMAAEPAIGTAG